MEVDTMTVKNQYHNGCDENISVYALLQQPEFKKQLIRDFELCGADMVKNSLLFKQHPQLWDALLQDDAYKKAFDAAMKEQDLDADGIPGRVDIDDTRNTVQTVADLSRIL